MIADQKSKVFNAWWRQSFAAKAAHKEDLLRHMYEVRWVSEQSIAVFLLLALRVSTSVPKKDLKVLVS